MLNSNPNDRDNDEQHVFRGNVDRNILLGEGITHSNNFLICQLSYKKKNVPEFFFSSALADKEVSGEEMCKSLCWYSQVCKSMFF